MQFETSEIERNKRNFKGLLTGLKRFIDEQIALKTTPHNTLKLYQEKIDKYKRLFGKSELEQVAESFGGELIN